MYGLTHLLPHGETSWNTTLVGSHRRCQDVITSPQGLWLVLPRFNCTNSPGGSQFNKTTNTTCYTVGHEKTASAGKGGAYIPSYCRGFLSNLR
ncbi:hypothetical protein FKM82_020364 [Ascaphus truei]